MKTCTYGCDLGKQDACDWQLQLKLPMGHNNTKRVFDLLLHAEVDKENDAHA